ncbi:ISAs1 family transposase, partial [Burkholderia sp. AW33-5]
MSIEDAFGELRDPRSRTPAHDLSEMLVVALCAILSGADSWVAIQIWGEEKLEWLRGYVPLRNGIPSHDTFGRVFAALNPRQFEACFTRWMSGAFPTFSGELVAIDGKTVRGSHRNGTRAIHLVSAFGSGLGVVLGQVRTAAAILELLDALLLKGAIVTIDAMGCQQAIARQLVTNDADYVLAVKENQPTLLVEIRSTLEALDRLQPEDRWDCSSEYREVEKDHGRIETRRCLVSDVMNTWRAAALWPGMRSIVMVEATREIGNTVTVERRYYASSLPPDATRIA